MPLSPHHPLATQALRGDWPDLLTVHRTRRVPDSIREAAVGFPVGFRWCSVTVNPYCIGIAISCTRYTGRSCVLWHFSTDSFPVSGRAAPADSGCRAVTFQIAYSCSLTRLNRSMFLFFQPIHTIFTRSNKYFILIFPGPSNN